MEQKRVDGISFAASLAVIGLVCVPLALFPDSGGKVLLRIYAFIAGELGFLYLMAGCGVLVLLGWLACSRYGGIVLGATAEQPEFSDYSWAAMLFCAGVGAGLMFWAPVEWAYYYDSPPFDVAARSSTAAAWASTYGIFHWGPTAWGFYCLPTLAIAYPYHVKRIPYLRFSTSCHYLLGAGDSTWGRLIDVLFMIALLGGAGSSLGFSTPMIAACLSRLTGLESSYGMEVFAVLLCVALFSASVWMGLRKGIKRLSDLNLLLAFVLLVFVLCVGPTVFLLKTSLNSVGLMLQNFIRMNSWTAAFSDSDFVEAWTVFYWAWWVAYGPFVGLFVTRISKGRTIRQVIFGMLGYGSLGGGLFYMILGNYGLHLELTGEVSITGVLREQGQSAAILAIFESLPGATLAIAAFCVVSIVFTATTYDSASYILASCATKRLEAGDEPARWHRLFWALALALLPLTLMAIGQRLDDPRSALKVVQTATLAVSFPILIVGVLMSVSLVRELRHDGGA